MRSTLTFIPVSFEPGHCLVPGQPENSTSLLIPLIWCQPQRSVISLPARPPHHCLTHISLLPHNHINTPHTSPARQGAQATKHSRQSFGPRPSWSLLTAQAGGRAILAHNCWSPRFSSHRVASEGALAPSLLPLPLCHRRVGSVARTLARRGLLLQLPPWTTPMLWSTGGVPSSSSIRPLSSPGLQIGGHRVRALLSWLASRTGPLALRRRSAFQSAPLILAETGRFSSCPSEIPRTPHRKWCLVLSVAPYRSI